MTRCLADYFHPTNKTLLNFSTFTLDDWFLTIDSKKSTITFKLTDSNSPSTTVPIAGKYQSIQTSRHSIFYDNGTIRNESSILIENFRFVGTMFESNDGQLILIQRGHTCKCGDPFDLDNIRNIYFCKQPNCHKPVCSQCAFDTTDYNQYCFNHGNEKYSECADFVIRIVKLTDVVQVISRHDKHEFKVDDVIDFSTNRRTFANIENNFYYDSCILHLHFKNETIFSMAIVTFDEPKTLSNFIQTQYFSQIHHESVPKVMSFWKDHWGKILKHKSQKFSYILFIDRKEETNFFISDAINKNIIPNDVSIKSQKMPMFYQLPILKFEGWTIFNHNAEALQDLTIKSPTIQANKGKTQVICGLWGGSVRTDYFSCFTNSQGERELWINNKLIMKNMQLMGYNYEIK